MNLVFINKPGTQLADCLASLIRYHHDNPDEKDAKKWFNRLKKEKKLEFELLVNLPQKTPPKRGQLAS